MAEYRKGRLAQHDVCDAHPELRRAAAQASEPTSMPCPICDDANVVLVTYAFGDQLPPSGRCITAKGELAKLAKGARRLNGYVVRCARVPLEPLARTTCSAPEAVAAAEGRWRETADMLDRSRGERSSPC